MVYFYIACYAVLYKSSNICMLVEERGLREGLAGLSFSFGDLRQSYFSCKQPKLLPEIKKKSVLEREESESEPRVGREAYVS